MKKYVNYHCHSDFSNAVVGADSATTVKEYIERIKELGHTVYTSVEHGSPVGWTDKYLACKKHGLKFVYGVEGYIALSPKVEKEAYSSYHIILLARTNEAIKHINRMLYDVDKNVVKSRPVITLDNFKKNYHPDIIVTNACVGGLFKEDTGNLIEEIYKVAGKSLWIEIAPHNIDIQKRMNIKAIQFAQERGLTIVSANDSHYITEEQAEDRLDLLAGNGIFYPEEEGFYMDYPSYDELVKRYELQGVVPKEIYLKAIENTNLIETFENLEMGEGGEFKVPTLYPNLTRKERVHKLIEITNERFKEYISKKPYSQEMIEKFVEEMKWEMREIVTCKMEDYFLTSMGILEEGIRRGGVITKSNRGSSSSFFVNMLYGFTTINRITSKIPILRERFMTADRILKAKTSPDIDNNVAKQEPFVEAQEALLGVGCSGPMLALGTLKAKSAFKMLCRAKGDIPVELQNLMSEKISQYEKDLSYCEDEIEKEQIKLEDYLDDEETMQMFQDGKKYFGLKTGAKKHPCGYLIANENLVEKFGVAYSPKGDRCINLEGKHAELFGLLKLDWLIVSVVDLTDRIWKEIGIPQPTADELQDMVKEDDKVWEIYSKGITMCVNQVEKPKTREKIMQFKPKTIEELSDAIAAVRPGFITYLKRFLSREKFEYCVREIDRILQGDYSESSWLIYQEQIMLILNYVGFDPKKTYETLKGIGKKKKELVEAAHDQFMQGCIQHIEAEGDSHEVAEEKAKSIWEVINNAAKYSFNASHSLGMAHDSLWVAYPKAHYPMETYKVCIEYHLERNEKNKVANIKNEAVHFFGIDIPYPRFRQDNRTVKRDNSAKLITLPLNYIKGVSETASEQLYALREYKGTFSQFILESNLGKGNFKNLIKTNYFEEFGNIGKLMFILENISNWDKITWTEPKLEDLYNSIEPYTKLSYELFKYNIEKIAIKKTAKQIKFENNYDVPNYIESIINIEDKESLYKIYWESKLTGMCSYDLPEGTIIAQIQKIRYYEKSNTYMFDVLNILTNEEKRIYVQNYSKANEKNIIYIPSVTEKIGKNGNIRYIMSNYTNLTAIYDIKKGVKKK